ncbi:hypothetical protein PILCRDRAFT_414109 [Piloderma croceum F 1598]|uniref:Uncharacterized protein n=1 Tax=Piloderma croceum (strain F 1598) TaxID=765440 RepID=A0A0C3FZY0_PILCF|nr:hypothetical protein PILCRDRAFT_414109 [Piloderma croceum F 1598]
MIAGNTSSSVFPNHIFHSALSILESASFVGGALWWTKTMNTFLLAPQICGLHIDFLISPSPHEVPMPWTQIAGLNVGAIHHHECLEIIEWSPNLVRCELGIKCLMESCRIRPTFLSSQLRFLHIFTSFDVGDLLDHLILPALLDVYFEQYGTQ